MHNRKWTSSLRMGCILLGMVALAGAREGVAAQLAAQAPSGSMMAFEIPNTAAFWQKAHALPLSQAIEQFLTSQAITSNLDYQQFDLERAKLAQALGYPASLDEFLGNVFSSAMFYAPGKKTDASPALVLILGVKDKTKAAKLLQTIDQKNTEATSGTLGDTPFTFEKIKINNVAVSHFHTGSASVPATDGYYALAGEKVVFSNDRARFSEAIGGAPAAAGTLGANPDFAKLKSVLKWDEADLVGWVDADALAQSGMAAMNPLMAALPTGAGANKIAMTMQVTADGIVSKAATTADPQKDSPNLKPVILKSLGEFSDSPLVAVCDGAFDPSKAFTEIKSLAKLPSMLPNMGGQSGDQSPSPLEQFEKATQISVETDLVPALGNEIALGINSIERDPNSPLPIPAVDLVFGVQVRNQAAMQGVMKKLEVYLQGLIKDLPNPTLDANGNALPREFKSIPVGAREIRSLDLGVPALAAFAPSYVLTPDLLMISINANSLTGALGRLGGTQKSLASSPLYGDMVRMAGTNKFYSFSQIDIGGVVKLVSGYMPMLASLGPQFNQPQLQQFLSAVLVHLGSAASIETRENDVAVSYGKITMQ